MTLALPTSHRYSTQFVHRNNVCPLRYPRVFPEMRSLTAAFAIAIFGCELVMLLVGAAAMVGQFVPQ